LTVLFPKAFFEDGRKRRPLKPNILADIERLGCNELIGTDVGKAVEYYMSHLGYQIGLSEAGTIRIDLDGRPVIKVTEQEARTAQQRVVEIKKAMTDQKAEFINGPQPTIASRPPRIDSLRATLSLAELLANAQKKLARIAGLIDSEDDEFRAKFLLTVIDETLADVQAMRTKV
jgi:hypothetical protein